MKYFTPTFNSFFKQLASNNTSDWFKEHRDTYEKSVKAPFHVFIEDVIARVQKMDKSVAIKSSDAVFRINRDIRFSKDKSPYKIHMAALVSKHGRKTREYPGLYIMLSPEKIMVGFGIYELEKPAIEKIRKAIAKDTAGFTRIVNAPAFKRKFGTVQGEKNKILPPVFKKVADKQPLIANKQFYVIAEFSAKQVTSDNLLKTVIEYYKTAKPFGDFLAKALK